MKRVSLADVAAELNVSKTLVSLVLNGKGDTHGISKSTQARVRDKASELNYVPNVLAQGLRSGKTGIIGLIVANIANPFYSTLARYIEDEINKLGYNLIICSSDEKVEKEMMILKMLQHRQVDGMIVSSTLQDPGPFNELMDQGFAIVLIDRKFSQQEISSVVVDNFQGMYDLTQHLIDQGHKKIGYLTVSPGHLSSLSERTQGYETALHDAKIKIVPSWKAMVPFDEINTSTKDYLLPMLRSQEGITALVTANNHIAVAAMECIRQNHYSIPEDIALASFDDIDLFHFCNPPVTACAQPRKMMAKEAVTLLLEQQNTLHESKHIRSVILKPRLLIRGSSIRETVYQTKSI